ncbi:unnamed protein product, partial [Amoebophrya sp. A25]
VTCVDVKISKNNAAMRAPHPGRGMGPGSGSFVCDPLMDSVESGLRAFRPQMRDQVERATERFLSSLQLSGRHRDLETFETRGW